ncbi:MAG: hypothetical protein GYA14_10120 [Ignavibacteria bacterium]|nr:hypothetical protein [Ignavibacteria bacterium]
MFILLIIAVIIVSGGFGFIRSLDFLAINTPLGTFEIGQTLIIVLLLGLFIYDKKNKIRMDNKILFPFYFFILIILFQFLHNIGEAQSMRVVIRNIKDGPFTFLIFFPLLYYINSNDKLKKYVQWLINIGIISAFVALFQFVFKIQLDFSTTLEFQPGVYRVYHPGALLVPLSIYIITSRLFDKNYRGIVIKDVASLLVLFGGMFSTLHRSLIISTFVLFLFVIVYNSISKKNIKVTFLLFLVSLGITFYFLSNTYMLDVLFIRVETAYSEMKYFEGNYYGRFFLFISMLTAVAKTSILFGVGFSYSNTYSSSLYVTNDNTYANLLVISGIIGLIIFLFICLYLIYKSYRLSISVNDGFYRIVLFSIAIYTVQWIALGIFADCVTYSPHIIYIVSTWVIYILIKYQLSKRRSYARTTAADIDSNAVV